MRRWDGVAWALAAFGALPLIAVRLAPLADWPSHLARVGITEQIFRGSAFWAERYHFNGLLIPNAILDAVVLGLLRLGLPLDQAGAVFLLSVYFTFLFGFVRLSRTCGNTRLVATASAMLVFYTGDVVFGLLNYLAGIAVLLLACSFWFRSDASVGRRIAVALIASPCLLFCHAVAALLFAGVGGMHDLFRPARTLLGRAGNLVPAMIALGIALSGYLLSAVADDNGHAVLYREGGSLLGLLKGKLHAAREGLTCGERAGDVLFAALLLGFGVLCWRARSRCDARLLAPIAALAVLALLAPFSVGDGSLVDVRLMVLPLVLAMAVLPWASGGLTGLHLCFVAAATVRTGLLLVSWAGFAPVYAALDAQLATLPPGSTLLGAYADPDPPFYATLQPPLWNSASLAVGHGVFVPSVFASATQQPLAVEPAWRPDWLWSHYANGRTPERLAAVTAQARRFCAIDPHTFLFVLRSPTDAERVSIVKLCD